MRPPSILILRMSALGDVIHTLPAVEAVRRAFPSARIAWLVERAYADLVQRTAPVDDVFVAATKSWRKRPFAAETRSEIFELRRALREFSRDGIAIDFQGLLKSAVFGPISGAPERYGFAPPFLKEGAARVFYTRTIPIDPSGHVVEWNVNLANGVSGRDGAVPDIRLDRLPSDPTGRLASIVKDAPVVLFPGAGRPEKVWPIERFAELSKLVSGVAGKTCVVAWGPGEEDVAKAIVENGDAILAPPTDLRELSFLVTRASAFVAADTGPLHLSAALHAPTIGLFGPTDPRRNGPWMQAENCVETFSSTRTMDAITVLDVFDRVRSILGRNAALA